MAEQVLRAARWPLDGGALAQLYLSLLTYILMDQLSNITEKRSLWKRWCRNLNDATWPEVLSSAGCSRKKQHVCTWPVDAMQNADDLAYAPAMNLVCLSRFAVHARDLQAVTGPG